MGTARPVAYSARLGGMKASRQGARPGRGRTAHAGAGGRSLGKQHTGYGHPAHAGAGGRMLDTQDAPDVAALPTPGREVGR